MKQFPSLLALAAYLLLNPVQQAKAQTDIHINGTVTDSITNAVLPGTKVVVIKNSNGERIDSTYTNSNGVYQLDFIWTAIHKEAISINKNYPNPSTGQTHIQYFASEAGIYNLQIFNSRGQQITFQQLELKQGHNTITTQGGPSGILLYVLSNENQKEIFKGIRIGENTPINITSITTQNEPQLKSTPDDRLLRIGDDATLEFSKTNYNTSNEQITIQPDMTVDKLLAPTPTIFTTTLKPYLETGESIHTVNPNFTTTIQWPDGTTNTYPIINDEIHIQKTLYTPNGEPGNAIFTHDTTTYNSNGLQNWIILRQPKQKTNRPNIAQNQITTGYLEPDYETIVPLDSLNNKTIHYYTIRKKAETRPGEYEYLNSWGSIGLLASSGNGAGASSFVDLSQYTNIDTLDIVQKGYNETTGQQMPQSDLDRAMNLLMMALETRYLPNGDTLLPPHRIYTIASTADPRWQALIARGFDNCIRTTYHNSTPGVAREWATNYTYNGAIRLKTSAARYDIASSDSQIFTENFSAVTGETEGSGSLSPFVWSSATGQLTPYAKSISTIPALLNLGTGQQK